jgi:hypothetical protein
MPFQVSFSSKATPVGVIDFFTAGPDQVTICDTTVTMTATVIGDLTGHVVLWEQLTGSAVTFITPLNQLSVTYTTATFDDKSFRFWIDKGTGEQQFDDINIFGTPTFPYYGGSPDQNCIINYGLWLRCNKPALQILDAFPLVPHGGVVECDTSSQPELHWNAFCEDDRRLQYVVQERSVAGPWTDEAILPPTATNYTPLNLGSTYRVVAVNLELNIASSAVSSNSVYVDGNISTNVGTAGVATSDSSTLGGQGSEPSIVYSVSLVTLLTCPLDAPDDQYIGAGPSPYRALTIPTYSVLDLTGGDIGGG